MLWYHYYPFILGSGLRKAADKTQVGIDKAKEVAVEKVAVAKEVIEDWNEQRKEAAQRKAYNRERINGIPMQRKRL